MAGAGVSGSRYALDWLVDHGRVLLHGDGSSTILAVVVNDDRLNVNVGASAQMRHGRLDRV